MLVKVYDLNSLSGRDVDDLCTRNPVYDPELFDFCRGVFAEVKDRGDEAVAEYTLKYDQVELSDCRVSAEEFHAAAGKIPKELNSALELAARNIRKFHSSQQMATNPVEVQAGGNLLEGGPCHPFGGSLCTRGNSGAALYRAYAGHSGCAGRLQ